ncbi:hypothetical protein C5C34_11635 [Rathayibacter rathayi]|nr:hypothetical protein C5C34_11635 [Rathayibacter rathayi]PPG92635.1 hypothetical protein C5C22_12705 [Rathayibacter rathayi]
MNVVGYIHLTPMGTALAYFLWFQGVRALPAHVPAFLKLPSPVIAGTIGVSWAGEVRSGS